MSIVDAIIGGLIGAIGTGLVGIMLFLYKERVRSKRLNKMIASELDNMHGFNPFEQGDPSRPPHVGAYPVYVYENNISEIGRLDEAEMIVEFYTDLISNKEYLRFEAEKEEPDWDLLLKNFGELRLKRDALLDRLS